jgi:hypothetical protein
MISYSVFSISALIGFLYGILSFIEYCGGINVMPNGWPLQRIRSMRKEEAETRSRGRILVVRSE